MRGSPRPHEHSPIPYNSLYIVIAGVNGVTI